MFHRLETKINQKTGLFKHLGVFTTLFFVFVISGFLLMDVKTSHAGTCGVPSIEGGMSTCTGGLNIVFNPTQPKIGEQVSVTVSLKDSGDANDFKSKGVTLFIDVILEEHWYGDDKVRVLNKSGNGASIQDSFLVAGIPKAGTYKTKVSMSYQTIAGPTVTNYSFSQDTQLTVLAAANTGGPKLNVSSSESYADGPNITKGISWVYLDGGSGKQAASYKVDCGDGKGDQAVSGGSTAYRCVYPKTAKDYSAKVTAYDASGAQLVAGAITNSVTGTESTQGAGSDPASSANPFGPLIIFINMVIGIILGFFQEIIYSIFYLLIAPIMQAMLSIHVYKDEFVSVIYPGWIVLRNLCNIIFIVAIMAIAMGTLLRVEAYKSRSVLVQLILAALMVNFSLVIGQVILGVADTVQSQFLPNNRDVIRALAKDLMVPYRATFQKLDIVQLGNFSETVKQFMFLILSIGSFMVFLAIAAFLFIRMVMLWILLLLSPLAYAAGALPQTSHYRKEWWTTFLKYAFFTPIMAFFLNLTAIIANTYKNNTIFTSIGLDSADFGGGAIGSIASFVFQAGSTLVLIVFLIVALKVAESFSIFGAGEISKFAKKGMFAPVGIAKWGAERGAGAIGRKWNEKTAHLMEEHHGHAPDWKKRLAFAVLNPKAVAKGWQKRTEELEHIATGLAEAQGRRVAEHFRTGGALEIPYNQFIERKDENEMLSDYENMKKESVMQAAVKATNLKGPEGDIRRRAIIKAAAKNGYLDDVLRMRYFADKYADDDGTIYSAEVLNRFLFDYLGNGEQAMRFMAEDMEELGKSTRHFEYLGHAYKDPTSGTFKRGMKETGEGTARSGGKFKKLKNTWQASYAAGEFAKVGGRERAGLAPHNIVPLRAQVDANGNFVEEGELDNSVSFGTKMDAQGNYVLDEYTRAILQKLDAATIRDINFSQSRTKEWVLSKNVDRNSGEIIVSNQEEVKKLEAMYAENPDYVKALYAITIGADPKSVKGVKVSVLDDQGKRSPANIKLGNPELNRAPITEAVSDEVMAKVSENPRFTKLKGEDKTKFRAVVEKHVEDVYSGRYTPAELKSVVQAEFVNMGDALQANADEFSTSVQAEVFSRTAEQYSVKYNPIPVIGSIDQKYGKVFSATNIGDLNRELCSAAESAFRETAAAGVKFSSAQGRDVLKQKIEASVSALRARPNGAIFQRLQPADIKKLVDHIAPTISAPTNNTP